MRLAACAPAGLLVALAMASAAGGSGAAPAQAAATRAIATVPPLPRIPFRLGNQRLVSDSHGVVYVSEAASDLVRRLRPINTLVRPGVEARFGRWARGSILFALHFRVDPVFVNPQGRVMDPATIESYTLKSSVGARLTVRAAGPIWLQGTRVVPFRQEGLRSKRIYHTFERVMVDGANVVNRGQQRFFPAARRPVQVALLYNRARIRARDALFHFRIGSAVRLRFPGGRTARYPFTRRGEVVIPSLPRGEYIAKIEGPGISFARPVALSRNQDIELQVITWLDIGVLVLAGLAAVAGLVLLRRRRASRITRAPASPPHVADG